MGNLLLLILVVAGGAAVQLLICHLAFRKFNLAELRQIERYEQESWEKYGWRKPLLDIKLGLRSLCGRDD